MLFPQDFEKKVAAPHLHSTSLLLLGFIVCDYGKKTLFWWSVDHWSVVAVCRRLRDAVVWAISSLVCLARLVFDFLRVFIRRKYSSLRYLVKMCIGKFCVGIRICENSYWKFHLDDQLVFRTRRVLFSVFLLERIRCSTYISSFFID